MIDDGQRDGPAAAITRRPRVVIVGAGFGGLRAARALAGAPVDVLLLDRMNYHLFTPLLYQVATAGLSPEEIAHPVRNILHGAENVAFRVATVRGVDLDARSLDTDAGPVLYDYLILAAGSTTNFFGLDLPEAQGLKDLPEAITLRNHIIAQCEQAMWQPDPETRKALLTFVVVGGGPTGVELAGALSELMRLVLQKDFPAIDFGEARIILLEAMDAVLGAFRPRLRRSALRALRRKGVDVRLGARVTRVEGEWVDLADGERIRTRTLVWAAGVRAADLAAQVSASHSRGGRLVVDEALRLPGHPEVLVIGDMAAFEQSGETLPMLAPVAIQEGEHAADTIRRAVAGLPARPFRYRNKGTMATIGRNAAVAQIGPVAISGFIAWLAWLALHLWQIIGFRNRLLVLINWIWDYFRYDRAARVIITMPPPPLPAARDERPAPAAPVRDDAAGT
jgi:NADH dehydrogenase